MQTLSPDQVADQIKQTQQAIEAIDPTAGGMPVTRVFEKWKLPDGKDAGPRSYIQEELGMFPMQKFVNLISGVVDSFVEGDMGMAIGDLFRGDVQMPVELNADAVDELVQENMQIFKAIIKAVKILPELQLEIICLSLGVPGREQDWFKLNIQEPVSRGGLSVPDAFDILKTFVRQNAPLLKETLLGEAKELVEIFQLEVLGEDPATSASTDSPQTDLDPDHGSIGGTPSTTSSPATPESV